ncbi:MAG: hypothetical protein ACQERF_08920 [Actinomycetota bacterium]
MSGSFIFLALCLAVAAAAMAPLWLGRRPEEGWFRWFADSFDAFRDRDAVDSAVDTSLEELFRDPDNQSLPGYTTPDELRGMFAETRARR